MKPSAYYDRIVDVVEELVRFPVLLRPHVDQLVDRYSERVEKDRPAAPPCRESRSGERMKGLFKEP